MMVTKEELSRDLQAFKCDISTLQRTADNLEKRINRLPDDPPKHVWRVGDWAWDEVVSHAFEIYAFDDNQLYERHDGGLVTNHQIADCTPIPAPLGIGTWIHGNEKSFEIKQRKYDAYMEDWVYRSRDDNMLADFSFHRQATVIPPPKFEVGEKVKHVSWKIIGKIIKRYWEMSGTTDNKPRWCYDLDDNSGYKGFYEENLTRVSHEWKVDEWAYHKPSERIFKIKRIFDVILWDSRDYGYGPEDCIPVHFIQHAESEIGEGSIVRTPIGGIGSVMRYFEKDSTWFVYGHNKSSAGWYSASELTLCAPEER